MGMGLHCVFNQNTGHRSSTLLNLGSSLPWYLFIYSVVSTQNAIINTLFHFRASRKGNKRENSGHLRFNS